MDNHGFIKVAASVPFCRIGDVRHNITEIISLITKAHKDNANIIVFPELSVTGYSCGDLFFSKTLQLAALRGLEEILSSTKDFDIVSIVGLPIYDGVRLYNCATVLHKGEILGIVPKTHIPTQSEYNQSRWFCSGNNKSGNNIEICSTQVPFNSNIVFDCKQVKFSIEICEDIFANVPLSAIHAQNGAEIIFNLASITSDVAGFDNIRTAVKHISFASSCGYVFVSAGVGESSADTLFSGLCCAAENGAILMEKNEYSFESNIFYTEIDLQQIESNRKKQIAFNNVIISNQPYHIVKTDLQIKNTNILSRKIKQFPFVPENPDIKNAQMKRIYEAVSFALAKRLRHCGINVPVLGVSGGLDSTLALLFTVHAADILKFNRSNIIGVTMPGFGTTESSFGNAKQLMELLGVTAREINIIPSCKQHFKDIGHDINDADVTFENAQARERTQILMDIANSENGMVIGTGDLSELALGWSTFAGDAISMYAVNSGIPKTLVRCLVEWIGKNELNPDGEKLTSSILKAPVSPELLPLDENNTIKQKTEDIIGDYALHDFFMYYFIRFGFTPEKIFFLAVNAFEGKYQPKYIKNCLKLFILRFFANQFKRSCMPDGPNIGIVSLSPRTGWLMPSDTHSKLWLEDL
ncbi:MAG: NAD(+) synthase [Clostridiaceae bacterium]|nr:NAD(+) synthase [Clostridiaceae bacterium]